MTVAGGSCPPRGGGWPSGPGEGPHRRYAPHRFFSDPHPPAAQAPSPTGKACGMFFLAAPTPCPYVPYVMWHIGATPPPAQRADFTRQSRISSARISPTKWISFKKPPFRRLVIGIYPVQHCAFSPVESPAGLEIHPVFHRPAVFPTEQKSQHCTTAHPKGHEK